LADGYPAGALPVPSKAVIDLRRCLCALGTNEWWWQNECWSGGPSARSFGAEKQATKRNLPALVTLKSTTSRVTSPVWLVRGFATSL
jgi:hypothetical protein